MQDLARVKDHLIGQDIDGTMSGISGGERRRVSVGISLVTDAQAIFLDEPTTGLDSESAETLMQLLARLAQKRGKTVSPYRALGVSWNNGHHERCLICEAQCFRPPVQLWCAKSAHSCTSSIPSFANGQMRTGNGSMAASLVSRALKTCRRARVTQSLPCMTGMAHVWHAQLPGLGKPCLQERATGALVGGPSCVELALQVVCTIHQPSSDICSLFDDAMLLSGKQYAFVACLVLSP